MTTANTNWGVHARMLFDEQTHLSYPTGAWMYAPLRAQPSLLLPFTWKVYIHVSRGDLFHITRSSRSENPKHWKKLRNLKHWCAQDTNKLVMFESLWASKTSKIGKPVLDELKKNKKESDSWLRGYTIGQFILEFLGRQLEGAGVQTLTQKVKPVDQTLYTP